MSPKCRHSVSYSHLIVAKLWRLVTVDDGVSISVLVLIYLVQRSGTAN